MTSKAVEKAARIQAALQEAGYEVSRHASSMIILAHGRLAATLHVYPDLCRLNIYTPWAPQLSREQEEIARIIAQHCARLEKNTAPYTPPSQPGQ